MGDNMQLTISHDLSEDLDLPLNYHHMIQGIVYHSLSDMPEYSRFVHDQGYDFSDRQYRMFVYGLLQGKYEIKGKRIIFKDHISFQVRSPEVSFIRLLKESIEKNGITYFQKKYDRVNLFMDNYAIKEDCIKIQMQSPICVYSTDADTGKTYFYAPDEEEFYNAINDNFIRKYTAYMGIEPKTVLDIKPVRVTPRDKMVTKYKGIYLSGWKGVYELYGDTEYLNFLYNTGLGSKNSQGFGLFDVLS